MSLCQIRQYRISNALNDGRALSDSLQRHVDGCSQCSEFLSKSRALGENLAPAEYEPPAWLRIRVMSNLLAGSPAARPASPARRWLPAAAGLAAIGTVAAIIAVSVNPADPVETTPRFAIKPPVPPVHPASVPERLERHAKQTLGKEFQDLATDISGARKFLGASLRNTLPGLRRE